MDVQQLYIGNDWMVSETDDRSLQFKCWSPSTNEYVLVQSLRAPVEPEPQPADGGQSAQQ